MAISLTPQELEEKLKQIFTPEQVASLLEALDSVRQAEISRAADTQELKQGLAALVEVQTRAEERLDRLEAAVERLVEAQARTEERLDRLEAAVERLVEAQTRTEERLDRLAEAQARTEERLDRLEAAVERLVEAQTRTEERLDRLAEAQARTEERLDRLEAAVERLVEAQARTEERLDRLAEAQARTEEQMREMILVQTNLLHKVDRIQARLDRVVGFQLEQKYRDKAYAYFGRYLRGVRVISLQEIENELRGRLSEQEFNELMPLDLLIQGQLREQPEGPEIWLAIEVSAVVDRHDVERAQRRAALLRKAGYRVIPTVAGEEVTSGGEDMARDHHTLLIQNGRTQFWPEAMATALQNYEHKP
jgi:chromosome segregation ATPase